MSRQQPGVVVTVADLARQAAENMHNETEEATADVVCILFVRLRSGHYVEAAAKQVSWDDWLVYNVTPGPPPTYKAGYQMDKSVEGKK